MDYEAMTAGELQQECARRGLPSSRAAKAAMVQRLVDHDTEQQPPLSVSEGEYVLSGEAVREAATAAFEPPTAEPIRSFRKTFTAEDGGPDEETHLAYRQDTIQAAAEAGLRPRGDARLADTRDGVWVYEVSVRQEMLS